MRRFFTKQRFMILFTLLLVTIFCWVVLPVSLPLLLAFFTSLSLTPLVKLLQKKFSLNQTLSVTIVFVLFITALGASTFFLTTKVITEGMELLNKAPQYINEIGVAWKQFEQNIIAASERFPKAVTEIIGSQIQSSLDFATQQIHDIDPIEKVTNFVKAIPSYLISGLVYLIALFLFMIELPALKEKFFNLLTDKTAQKVSFMGNQLKNVVCGFFKAQFLVSILIFAVTLIGLLFIKPEMAIIMSLLIWIIDFIPIIGSIVIMAPWSVYYYITGDIHTGTQLAVLGAILLIIRRTVEPKVMGTQMGLSPLLTLITMYIGLQLVGFIGLLVGPLLLIAFNTAKEAGLIKINIKL